MGLFSLIQGISRYHDTCSTPLPLWLIIIAVLQLSQVLLGCVMFRIGRTYDEEALRSTSPDRPLWARLYAPLHQTFLVANILFLGWMVLGCLWFFSTDSSDCTNEIYSSAERSLIVVVIIPCVVLPIVLIRRYCQGRRRKAIQVTNQVSTSTAFDEADLP
jgi:hypothetical protein